MPANGERRAAVSKMPLGTHGAAYQSAMNSAMNAGADAKKKGKKKSKEKYAM